MVDLSFQDAPNMVGLAQADNELSGPDMTKINDQPKLTDDVINDRAARADFALADKSPGHDVLKSSIASGKSQPSGRM